MTKRNISDGDWPGSDAVASESHAAGQRAGASRDPVETLQRAVAGHAGDRKTAGRGRPDALHGIEEDLHRRRAELDELSRLHSDYHGAKRELIACLRLASADVEKKEAFRNQFGDALSEARERFREMLSTLLDMREDTSEQADVRDDMMKRQDVLEKTRQEYGRLVARLEALGGELAVPSVRLPDDPGRAGKVQGFGYWLRVGFAVTLPVLLTLIALLVVYLILINWNL